MVRSSGKNASTPLTSNEPLLNGLVARTLPCSSAATSLDQIAFAPDILDIGIVQPDAAPGALAARLHSRAAAEQDDDVLAQRLHVVALAFLEAIAHRDDQHDGSDAPGDSRHGEKAAQLVAQQASQSPGRSSSVR